MFHWLLCIRNKQTILTLFPFLLPQLQEEHQKALLRRDFQLQSLGLQARLQQKLWSQERTLLVQESQHLKQALLLLSLKLRCFLKQWRLGCKKDTEWKDILEVWRDRKENASVQLSSLSSFIFFYIIILTRNFDLSIFSLAINLK